MKRELTQILSLPGVIVKSKKEVEETLILEVEKSLKSACCPRCQKVSDRLHQNHWHLIKDLPWGEKEVFLKVNRRQFKCNHCSKPFSEELNFVKKKQKHTKRYAQLVSQEVVEATPPLKGGASIDFVNSNLRSVAKRHNLTEDEVESMINQVSQEILPINLEELKRLGIDEITLVKGQGKFIIVLVDLDTGNLIGLVKERKAKTLEEYLKSWGEKILEKIEEVSMDLYRMYENVIEKVCPKAVITVDRFHVTKLLHQELNQGRIDQKKSAESLQIKPRQQLLSSLKGGKYVLLKREENLTLKQKEKLKEMKKASVMLEIMHQLKEEFTAIFDESKNLGEGTLKLADWLIKAQGFFPKTVRTVKNWFVEIVGYFERKTTNAIVEGINNRLKVLKRCGFGFRNFENFKKRSLLFWHLSNNLA